MEQSDTEVRNLSEAGRLLGIFWEPRPVFEDLAARPRWWVPLILLTVLAITYVAAFSRVVGWETFMQQQFETNPRLQQLPAEQREQVLEQQTKFAGMFAYAGAAVAIAVSMLLISAVLLGVFNYAGGADLRFRQVFSITSYSFLPTALSTILAMLVMFLKPPEDFDLQNPLPLNVGAFLSPTETPAWLQSIATSIDAFSIWVMLLLAFGLSVAARRIPYSRSLTLVISAWVVWLVLKAGWAALFS